MNPLQLTRSVQGLNRLRVIAQVLTRHGFGYVVAQLNLSRFVPLGLLRRKRTIPTGEEGPSSVGRRLVDVASELGPTFIKLGQMLSTRPDVLPPDVLAELRLLQDEVPPFSSDQARNIIQKELGRSTADCFEEFADEPFASASIGQVYRATLKDGTAVVVKVRRPGIQRTIELDMLVLRWMADSLESLMPEIKSYRPVMLVDEFEQALFRELDYINEASTTERFGRAFRNDFGFRIPQVYWEFTAPSILTLEWLPGKNVDALLGQADRDSTVMDRRLVARRLTEGYLKQVFELGTFHADPHPGNVLIDPPATVGLIDFGQIGTLSTDLMTELVVLTYACVNREIDMVVDTFADMEALSRDTDRRSLRRALQMLLDKYYGLPIKRLDVGTLFSEFSDVIRRHDVVIPRDFALLIKALGTVGSTTRRLDPDLNLLELLGPKVRKALHERFSTGEVARAATLVGWDLLSIVRKAPSQLRSFLRRLSSHGWELHVRHENIDKLIQELDRSSNRIAFSVVIAAIIVGSSVVFSAATDMTVFGFRVQYFGILGYLVAGFLGLGLSWAIFRSGRLH